jgi:catecholate siderophore receptor
MLSERIFFVGGYTYLDGEVVRAVPGVPTGAPLPNAPEHSLSAWADARISDRLDVGVGARYVGEQLAAAGKSVPDYWLFDAMARYTVSESLTVKINLANLTDEYYFEQLHPWHVVPGASFTATFAVNYSFEP